MTMATPDLITHLLQRTDTPANWRGLDRSGISWRIQQAVHYKLLATCGENAKVGNYNTFEETEVERWIAGGCKYSWPEGGKG